jgi:predicted RNA-binding Zn-ribbon protein involved in translation (DUF1610 family)
MSVHDNVANDKSGRPFPGFPTPSFTPVPDIFFDELLPQLDNGELRVVLYTMRHTYGWRKTEDWITLDQFEHGQRNRDGSWRDRGCGLSRPAIARALRQAIAHGYLVERISCRHCGTEVTRSEIVRQPAGRKDRQRDVELRLVPKSCPECGKALRGRNEVHAYGLCIADEVDQLSNLTDHITDQLSNLTNSGGGPVKQLN